MQIISSRNFKKQFKKLPEKIQKQFANRIELLQNTPSHPQLSIHKLSGKLTGLWSLNVTGDIRAIFDRENPNVIFFIAIGQHSELYE